MIRVAIVGIGNCASTLIQGKYYYHQHKNMVGIKNAQIGKYSIDDIEFVCAFDVDRRKVGKDLSEAIFQAPNSSTIFCQVPFLGVTVLKGHVYDGIAPHMSDTFLNCDEQSSVNVADELQKKQVDILINYLPVGSKKATEFYASECLKAKVAFINAIPEFICSDRNWEKKFIAAKIPCAGDDIKSQVGATIINRVLTELVYGRGCIIENMYQLNIGGNTDFMNMLEESRLKSKRISKTQSVLSVIKEGEKMPEVKIGPSEHIPHLGDSKICYINIKGRQFAGVPFEIDLKLKVEDSPNSAGVMLDVIRLLQIAKDNNISGNIPAINAFAFKSPSLQFSDGQSDNLVNDFITKYSLL